MIRVFHVKPRQSPPWSIHSPAMDQAFASYDVVVARDAHYETVGQVLLGNPPEVFL
jgi:hypothetical protein